MTVVDTALRSYQRTDDTLSRDIGLHVLLLAATGPGQVHVLSGGSATLWRLLEQRRSISDLRVAFDDSEGRPSSTQLREALDELVALGVVATLPEQGS